MSTDPLLLQAQQILRHNDRGGYTVPSAKLYPFQWNWDAAINAVGWQTFDEDRAWLEIEYLLKGLWANGLLPHVVFHQPSDTYFPGPSEWGCEHLTPPTTSISQPPVLSTMVRLMAQRSRDPNVQTRIAQLVPQLLRHHTWWHTDRDPEGTGLVVSYHPWESGNDNSPAWDAPLAAVPAATRPYTRKDLGLADSKHRPHQHEYDRYVYLMDFFRECKFDAMRIYRESPYCVVDVAMNAVLIRADRDLAALCESVGLRREAQTVARWANRGAAAIETLWDDKLGFHVSKDMRSQQFLPTPTHAGMMAWYAQLPTTREPERRAVMQRQLDARLASTPCALASCDPKAPGFDPLRYWRGPVWPHINWLLGSSLRELGLNEQAQRLSNDTLALIQRSGFFENYCPLTGEGLGGPDFSWTAAVYLSLKAESVTAGSVP